MSTEVLPLLLLLLLTLITDAKVFKNENNYGRSRRFSKVHSAAH